MRLVSLTPDATGKLITRTYEAKKSSAVTAPSVASRILERCSRRGMRTPATYRDTAACSTPISSANLPCEMPLSAKKSASFMPSTYHTGMSEQELYAKLDLDNWGRGQYHNGMSALSELREEMGRRLGREVTQTEVGNTIGVTQATISRYEDGTRKVPFERALALSKFYKVKIGRLVPALELNEKRALTRFW
jgi:DNA-binding XRE family transcriptional regulator